MKWNKVFNSHRPKEKQDPLTAFMLGSALVGGIGSAISTSDTNAQNKQLAREARDWQSAENQKNRDFTKTMWDLQNEYNTPANQRKLAEDGGYNPYLLGEDSLGSTAGAASAPSMVGAPDVARVSPVNPAGAFVDSASQLMPLALQSQQVESNVEMQRTKSVQALAQTAIDAYDKLGYAGYKELMDKISPVLSSVNMQGSRSDILFQETLKNYLSERYNKDMDSLNKEWQYQIGKKYDEKQIQSGLEQIEYNISEIVGRLHTMNIQNEALIKRTANEIVVGAAQAFHLRKVGDKYEADAKTANLLRNTIERILKGKATQEEVNAYFATASKESSTDLVGYATSERGRHAKQEAYRIPLERNADAIWTAVDRTFSEYIKASASGSAGSYGSVESYNSSEYGNTLFGW